MYILKDTMSHVLSILIDNQCNVELIISFNWYMSKMLKWLQILVNLGNYLVPHVAKLIFNIITHDNLALETNISFWVILYMVNDEI